MSQRFFFNPIRHTSLGLAVLGCRWSAWQLRRSCPLLIMVAQGLLAPPVPRELAIEAKITENMTTTIDQLKEIGDKSDFVCAHCGGGLYAIRNDPAHRYRCHTGHVYTEQLLQDIQGLHLEESVYGFLSGCWRNAITCYCSWRTMRQMPARRQSLMESRQQAAAMQKHISQLKLLLRKLT
jgi:hypothetical protein